MKQIIFDTSFIISAVRNRIDFFGELAEYKKIIPRQVVEEIKKIKNKDSELSLKILEKNSFEEVDLGKGHVDKLIIRFAKENPKIIVATLDKEIKEKLKNSKLVIRGKKKIEII